MKDKTDRLLEMLDNPGRYTDEDLEALLRDREMMELYNTISKTADVLTETPEADTDVEWQKFARSHFRAKRLNILRLISGFVSRNVAAVVLCIVASLVVVATTVGIRYTVDKGPEIDEPETIAIKGAESDQVNDMVYNDGLQTEATETIVFKNRTLENIISEIAQYYGATAIFKSSGSKKLRLYFQWDQALPLKDVIEQLNSFESINVKLSDNEIIID